MFQRLRYAVTLKKVAEFQFETQPLFFIKTIFKSDLLINRKGVL